jgi:hypothetical protein
LQRARLDKFEAGHTPIPQAAAKLNAKSSGRCGRIKDVLVRQRCCIAA